MACCAHRESGRLYTGRS
uniref:Uncharacterized protein n=1 Tax=Rhizophora mucronata TaxID=61149 RepID=A0A2P2QE51_RHIMU